MCRPCHKQSDLSLSGIGYCRTCRKREEQSCPHPERAVHWSGECLAWEPAQSRYDERTEMVGEGFHNRREYQRYCEDCRDRERRERAGAPDS